jgi:hypothetical protein
MVVSCIVAWATDCPGHILYIRLSAPGKRTITTNAHPARSEQEIVAEAGVHPRARSVLRLHVTFGIERLRVLVDIWIVEYRIWLE